MGLPGSTLIPPRQNIGANAHFDFRHLEFRHARKSKFHRAPVFRQGMPERGIALAIGSDGFRIAHCNRQMFAVIGAPIDPPAWNIQGAQLPGARQDQAQPVFRKECFSLFPMRRHGQCGARTVAFALGVERSGGGRISIGSTAPFGRGSPGV